MSAMLQISNLHAVVDNKPIPKGLTLFAWAVP